MVGGEEESEGTYIATMHNYGSQLFSGRFWLASSDSYQGDLAEQVSKQKGTKTREYQLSIAGVVTGHRFLLANTHGGASNTRW